MRLSTARFTGLACALLALRLFTWAPPASAQANEAELKAAIIVNMLLFVDSPAAASGIEPLTLCHLNESPVATALSRLDGRMLKGKSLRIRQATPDALAGCQLLYIPPGNAAALARIVGASRPASLFLAGDSPDYLDRGIMLNLEVVDGRVVFDIDLRATQKAGLQISSKALRLARTVVEP